MNKRQRKKLISFYEKRGIRHRIRCDFGIFQEEINKVDYVTHQTLDNIYTYGYIPAIRVAMKKIATINSKQRGYHRHTKWNWNRIKFKY